MSKNLRICSFNTLYYNYSNGFSSFRDQLRIAQQMLLIERPDVAVLLEMPNPSQFFSGTGKMPNPAGFNSTPNIALMQYLENFRTFAQHNGYIYQRTLNDMLSVWVLSKLPLVPMTLLGSETVGGALGQMFRIHPTEKVSKLNSNSDGDFIDAVATACGFPFTDAKEITREQNFERTLMFGVVSEIINENNNKTGTCRVLPVIATHAGCKFWNSRYGMMMGTMMRAAVANKGVAVGDFNFDILNDSTHLLSAKDPRIEKELNDKTPLENFASLPTGVACQFLGNFNNKSENSKRKVSAASIASENNNQNENAESSSSSPLATCVSIDFPYRPLAIDGAFSKTPLQVKVGCPPSLLSSKEVAEQTIMPCEDHPSDHRWISFDCPKEIQLEVPCRWVPADYSSYALGGGLFVNHLLSDNNKNAKEEKQEEGGFVLDARNCIRSFSESHSDLFNLKDQGPKVLSRPKKPQQSSSSSNDQQEKESGARRPRED